MGHGSQKSNDKKTKFPKGNLGKYNRVGFDETYLVSHDLGEEPNLLSSQNMISRQVIFSCFSIQCLALPKPRRQHVPHPTKPSIIIMTWSETKVIINVDLLASFPSQQQNVVDRQVLNQTSSTTHQKRGPLYTPKAITIAIAIAIEWTVTKASQSESVLGQTT